MGCERMLKVLEVNVDDHLYGGVYVLVKNIIKYLPSYINADIAALEPFDDDNHIKELNGYGSNVYYVGSNRNKILKQIEIYRNVKKLIKENQYDVVHLHSDVSHKILVSALASKRAKKLIFHSHANDADGGHLRARRLFHRFCCLFLKGIPATYIATSKDSGKWMFPWAKEEDIIILDNGIEYRRYSLDLNKRKKIREELCIKDQLLIGLFGRFVPPKNPLYAVDILHAILKENQNVRMLCIGEGPLKQEFIQRIKEAGLDKYVMFMGNTDVIEDYYQAIDVLIMPSNNEGFGLVAVESQISGTPTLVSTNVPEMTRISKIIQYLPLGPNDVDKWKDAIIDAKNYIKKDISREIDYKYELCHLVDKIASIYIDQEVKQ